MPKNNPGSSGNKGRKMNPGQGGKVSPKRGEQKDTSGGKGAGSAKQGAKKANPTKGAQGGMRGKKPAK